MDHVCFDVEIAKTVEEVGGWHNTKDMGVAVACLWEYQTQRMRIYGSQDVEALKERILKADKISSFNGFLFDYPVVFSATKEEWKTHPMRSILAPKTNDLLRRIWQALGLNPDVFGPQHKGWGLDAVAGSTLGVHKIGYGGDAPKWYQQGLFAKVASYCADDVAIERDLTDFVDRYGFVLNGDRVLRIPPWQGA